MHDHIEEMGRNIVRRDHPNMPEKHSRLWIEDEIEDIIVSDVGTEATKCIRFNTLGLNPGTIMQGLRKMKELRFLDVSLRYIGASKNEYVRWNCNLNEVSPYFPNALRYLRWDGYPYRFLPKTFKENNLAALKMAHSRIVQLWEGGERKVLNKLRFFDLSYSMLRTLDLGLTPNLVTLTLGNCGHMVELPDSICMLKHLKFLNLNGCSLHEKLPEDLGGLECLETLSLSYTNIKNLPDSICLLKRLESLKLEYCLLLEVLPEDLGRLECLEQLSLSYTNVKHLPDSICMLKHLKILDLYNCSLLEKLPENLSQSQCLEKLDLSYTNIKHLPDNICMLKEPESLLSQMAFVC